MKKAKLTADYNCPFCGMLADPRNDRREVVDISKRASHVQFAHKDEWEKRRRK